MTSQPANVIVVYYSMYGHVRTLAEAVAKGAASTGASVKVFQIAETLPKEVLEKMHAPPKADHPIATPNDLAEADGIIFGIPTRYGAAAAQVKALFDSTGQLWAQGKLVGKVGSVFFSTATQGGGQETTALTTYTQLVHHGMVIVPIGYSASQIMNNSEMHGGSPYGAGTIAGGMGERLPSKLELEVAEHQGKHVATITNALKAGRNALAHAAPAAATTAAAPSGELELVYFNGKGRAELSRLIAAEAKIPIKDTRIEFKDWPALKPTTPFGQLPLLKTEGMVIPQSQSIARFLARKAGLVGSNAVETSEIDALAESARDLRDKYFEAYFAKEEKEAKLATFFNETVPKSADFWEPLLKQHGGQFFYGNKLSYADLAIFDVLTQIQGGKADILAKYPTLSAFVTAVAARPNIAAHLSVKH